MNWWGAGLFHWSLLDACTHVPWKENLFVIAAKPIMFYLDYFMTLVDVTRFWYCDCNGTCKLNSSTPVLESQINSSSPLTISFHLVLQPTFIQIHCPSSSWYTSTQAYLYHLSYILYFMFPRNLVSKGELHRNNPVLYLLLGLSNFWPIGFSCPWAFHTSCQFQFLRHPFWLCNNVQKQIM